MFTTKVQPNQMWQDHSPRDYNQTVRVAFTLPYLIGSYVSCMFCNNAIKLEVREISLYWKIIDWQALGS